MTTPKMWTRTFIIAYLGLSLLAPSAKSAELRYKNWETTGFLTLGYTQTDKYDDRVLRRNVSQDGQELHDNGFLVDSRFGLQLTGDLNDHWEMVFQAVLKEQYANNMFDYVDMAFARYRASDDWQLALGRQPFDTFIMSDHVNVGYSFDWVRPPTEFYGYIPFDSFDGIKVTRDWGDFDNAWKWSLSVGFIEDLFEIEVADEPEDDGADEVKARPIYNTELSWRSDKWHVRANYAHLEFKLDSENSRAFRDFENAFRPLWPDFSQITSDFAVNNKMSYAAIGAAWQSGNWKIQSEISTINADFVYYDGERAYLHFAYRYDEFLPFLTFGYASDDSNNTYDVPQITEPGAEELQGLFDLVGIGLAEAVLSVKNNQTSISAGLRWDYAPQKALKFQCDRFNFDANSASTHGRFDQDYSRAEQKTWCSATFDWAF